MTLGRSRTNIKREWQRKLINLSWATGQTTKRVGSFDYSTAHAIVLSTCCLQSSTQTTIEESTSPNWDIYHTPGWTQSQITSHSQPVGRRRSRTNACPCAVVGFDTIVNKAEYKPFHETTADVRTEGERWALLDDQATGTSTVSDSYRMILNIHNNYKQVS